MVVISVEIDLMQRRHHMRSALQLIESRSAGRDVDEGAIQIRMRQFVTEPDRPLLAYKLVQGDDQRLFLIIEPLSRARGRIGDRRERAAVSQDANGLSAV